MNEIITKQSQDTIIELQNTNKLCDMLMQTPHYKRLGHEGIYAIVAKAKSIGACPMDCLNGGMYYVKGKVELSAAMMNQLIRQHGHCITKDKQSNDSVCILHGKRKDTGDVWMESFSIEEAKRAGIYSGVWQRYPRDMLFARALSRLARQLFPDVIKGCYVEGEIKGNFNDPVVEENYSEEKEESYVDTITQQEATYIEQLIDGDDEYKNRLLNFLVENHKTNQISEMPRSLYDKILPPILKRYEKRMQEMQNGEVA